MIPATEPRTRPELDLGWDPIESEHRALRGLADRLEGTLVEIAGTGRRCGVDVGALLEEFCHRLFVHFDVEERSGLIEEAARNEPRLGRRFAGLRGEHDELRRRALALVGELGAEDPFDWTAFHLRFVELRSLLDAHEQAENDLVHSAYLEDHGGRG